MIAGGTEIAVVAVLGLVSGAGSMILKDLGETKMAVWLGVASFVGAGVVVVKLIKAFVDEVESVFGVHLL